MRALVQEIRYATRSLQRNRAFAAAAVTALSLGIAANTAIFSVVNKVLLEPLPYPDPGRLVQLMSTSPLGDQVLVSVPKFCVWREHTHSFESMAAYDFASPAVNLTETDTPEALQTARVTSDYFHLFGAAVMAGRTFTGAEDEPGARCTAVISDRLWRGRFGGRRDLVGSAISLNRAPCKVVGILSPAWKADGPVDIWLPLQPDPAIADHMNRLHAAARLKSGVTVDIVADEVQKTIRWFSAEYYNAPLLYGERFTAVPLRDGVMGNVRPALLLLTGAVGFVLLLACANAGALILARSSRRAAEIAVRSALGAGRSQLVRQLLLETMLLALASAIAGLALGFGGVRGLLVLSPVDLPGAGFNGSAIGLDWRVFAFTFLVSLVSGLVCGLAPAVSASRADLMVLVKDVPADSGMGFRRGGLRAALISGQIAFALVLLAGAGLLIRTFVSARTENRGFDENGVVTAQMSLDGPLFEQTDQTAEFIGRVEHNMKQTPGVAEVAATSSLPMQPTLIMPFTIPSHDQTVVGLYHGAAAWRSVSPDYFAAFHIRLLRGRVFSRDDGVHSAPVALINRMMMKKFWPEIDANPIGDFIIINKGPRRELEDLPRQIVGVVDDVREAGLNRELALYVPIAQLPDGLTARTHRLMPLIWAIRTTGDQVSQASLARELQQTAGLPLGQIRTMHEIVAASSARAQFFTLLLTVFGVVSLVLAAVGLYGVMAYSVQQRTREIGVRMALGAELADIRSMVVWQGMRLALIGIGVGVPAAAALGRILLATIFGVPLLDPTVIVGVAAVLAITALAAAYLPAIRATSVNPCEALRR